MAGLLDVDLLTPLLKLTLTAYSMDGSVVDLAEVFYRSDRYKHHGFLTRNRGKGSSFWNGSADDPAAGAPPGAVLRVRPGTRIRPRDDGACRHMAGPQTGASCSINMTTY